MRILSTIFPQMYGLLSFMIKEIVIVKCVIFVLLLIYEKLDWFIRVALMTMFTRILNTWIGKKSLQRVFCNIITEINSRPEVKYSIFEMCWETGRIETYFITFNQNNIFHSYVHFAVPSINTMHHHWPFGKSYNNCKVLVI